MIHDSDRHRQDLIELFGEENLYDSCDEEYVDINEAVQLIAFGGYAWPVRGPQSFFFWKDLETVSTYLNPSNENLTLHSNTLEIFKTGLANSGRKLLARRYEYVRDNSLRPQHSDGARKLPFEWLDPSELEESGFYPMDDSRPIFHAGGTFDLVLVKKRDLEPFRKLFQNDASSSTEISWSSSSEVSNRLGRPRQWDWDAIFCRIVLIANTTDGLPETQSKLIQEIMDFCMQTYGDYPSVSQIKKKTKPIYDALKSKAHNSK